MAFKPFLLAVVFLYFLSPVVCDAIIFVMTQPNLILLRDVLLFLPFLILNN